MGTSRWKYTLLIKGILVDCICSSDSQEWWDFHRYKQGKPYIWQPLVLEILERTNFSHTRLLALCTILTAGKGWDGLPIESTQDHYADFAACLQFGFFVMALRQNAFGEMPETDHKKENESGSEPEQYVKNVHELPADGNAHRFINAAETSGRLRTRFITLGGRYG